MKLLFISDPHGANSVFNKSLLAVEKYDIDLLIIAGDLTAKEIRPIIKRTDRSYLVNYRGKSEIVNEGEIVNIEKYLSSYGNYFFHINESEFEDLQKDSSKIISIFDQKSKEKIQEWCETLIKKIDLRKCSVLLTPGNDDTFEIDEVLNTFKEKGIYSDCNNPFRINSIDVLSLEYSNQTPWETPRELPEKSLGKLIEDRIKKIDSPSKTIFNFHCPPFKTKIDLAPELDKDHKKIVIPGGENKIHVGSIAIREAIEKYQPIVSLHGHIHEAPGEDHIGKTICLNPGSEYWNGLLYGYIVDMENESTIKSYYRIKG